MCERAIYKLTQIQRSLIRMHQQLTDATEKMEAEMDGEFQRKGMEISDPNHNPTAHPVVGESNFDEISLIQDSCKSRYT